MLDTSAILSYAAGYVHVGELAVDIADEGAYVGLPACALLAAYAHHLADRHAQARLGVLAALPAVEILPLGAAEAAEVAADVPLVKGDLARAQAVWAALEHGAYYLTCEPDLVQEIVPDVQVHIIPDEDA